MLSRLPRALRARLFVKARHLLAVVIAVSVALALAACGQLSHPTVGDGEAIYVDAGPIAYQVQLSRQLNQFSIEDKQYLVGVTAAPPRPDQEWFGVFMWAKNPTKLAHTTTDRFAIVDTQGNRYYPVPVNPQVNPFVWTAQALQPGGTQPDPNTAAAFSPPQGQVLLFKLNDTVYSNRPLILQIYAPGQARPSTISLDL
jgi:hypothetical protein